MIVFLLHEDIQDFLIQDSVKISLSKGHLSVCLVQNCLYSVRGSSAYLCKGITSYYPKCILIDGKESKPNLVYPNDN